MLVLSRKIDEQIMIGDDITLTVVRIDSGRVRIGINAPRDKRILRGEIARKELPSVDAEDEQTISRREQAFAHPPTAPVRLPSPAPSPAHPSLIAPLAGFVSAS